MISVLRRKFSQLASDPGLRRYLLERALGRIRPPAPYIVGHPPYLTSLELGQPERTRLAWFEPSPPSQPLTLELPGHRVTLEAEDPGALFEQTFPDLETRLAIHRFAWLPLQLRNIDPAWVAALWNAWFLRYGNPNENWEWHPYTVAERAINLMDFSRLYGGFPAPTFGDALASHAIAIAARLEYGGEHYTGNHLSNNGRGLYLLGLTLDWPQATQMGFDILRHESQRIFSRSGILHEGSSHYHLLLTRNYLSAWLAAKRHHRDLKEIKALETVCIRALSILPHLNLPGRFPLIGDISPDSPPSFLAGLMTNQSVGWLANQTVDEQAEITALATRCGDADCSVLAADGWIRADGYDWSLLAHASPQGWPLIPGHGHHDLGSFELHWRGLPLIVDPGRGSYGEQGEAALYRSATVHNLLQIDNADPTPANKPYYDDMFRQREGGGFPCLSRNGNRVCLVHHGFRRHGTSECQRTWNLDTCSVTIEDRVFGHGRHQLCRSLVTPCPIALDSRGAVIQTPKGSIRVHGDSVRSEAITIWNAYGQGSKGNILRLQESVNLPWSGCLKMEAI